MRTRWKDFGLGTLTLVAIVAAILVGEMVIRRHVPGVAAGGLTALLVLATYIAASKWIERRAVSDLDATRLLPEVVSGLVAGFALFAIVMAVLWAAGVYHPAGRGAASGLAASLVAAAAAGVSEEVLFRGVLFRVSAKLLGTWGALLFTAALFGVGHAFNHGATASSSLAIAIEAGVLLAAAYAATQRLWVPIGLHIGWNFTESAIFSMSVSGGHARDGLIRGSLTGPRILTGGAFGPEASIVAVVICFAAALYFIRRIVVLHRIEPAAWQ
jgi:membrane protease YdiL (CAAX protease family)